MTKRATVLVLAALFMLAMLGCSRGPSYPESHVEGQAVVIDTASLEVGVPLFLSHRFEGRHIRFFVLMSEDRVMSFYDACETCYPRKKGFSYEKGYVTCRSCGESFSVEDIETGVGGCYPIRLPGRLESGKYIIELYDLRKQARKF